MEISKLFATPFWQTKLNIDTSAIAAKCIAMRDSNYPNRKVSNRGGWQSKPLQIGSIPEFKDLESELRLNLNLIAKSINPDLKLGLSNGWININEKGDSNLRHTHAAAALSAVIYIQVDEKTGRIRFYDDQSPIKHYPFRMSSKRNHFRLEESFKPYNGMLLAFPGWVPHEVEPSQSDITRISIAVNIHVADAYE